MGYYFSKNEGKCIKCHDSCYECEGPSKQDCLSVNKEYLYGNKIISCLQTQFYNEQLKKCSKCYDNCLECIS